MSNYCNSTGNTNNTSLSGLVDIIESLLEVKFQANIQHMNTRFETLEAEMKKIKEYVKKAEDAANIAQAAKNHAMASVQSIDTSMAEMSEKLREGFNVVAEITIGNKKYFFKHGILIRVEDV